MHANVRLWRASLLAMSVAGSTPLASAADAVDTGVRYADQFPGDDWCAKVSNAIASLPPSGGVVSAARFSGLLAPCANSIIISEPAHPPLDFDEPRPRRPVTLLLGAATYPLGPATLNVNQSGAQILGLGPEVSVITYAGNAGSGGSAISSMKTADWYDQYTEGNRYEGFALKFVGGSLPSNASIGMYLVRPVRNEIRRVKVDGFDGSGIVLDTGGQSYGTLNIIDGVDVRCGANYGIVLTGANPGGQIAGTRITNSHFQADGTRGVGVDIRLDGSANTYLAGNYFEGTRACGPADPNQPKQTQCQPPQQSVEACDPWTGTGVWITGTTPANNTKLVGNFFEGLANGILADPVDPSKGPLGTAELSSSFMYVTTNRSGPITWWSP